MPTKAELIAQLDEARAEMRRLLADIEAAHIDHQELYPTWTIKELLSHITGWDDASIDSMRAVMAGETPLTPAQRGINPYNASTVSERESLSLEQVIAEWEHTREDFKQAIRDLPQSLFDKPFVFAWGQNGTVSELVAVFSEHEKEHAEEIREKVIGEK